MFLLWKTGGLTCLLLAFLNAPGQSFRLDSFRLYNNVRVIIDRPVQLRKGKVHLVIYALPNGNSIEWTMGKRRQEKDDWHFDIQHIAAQTRFVREKDPSRDYVVAYLGNDLLSWPAWKRQYGGEPGKIPAIVDSVAGRLGMEDISIHLNGHSGGGSFIFGYLAGVNRIPSGIKRISFLDSNYGFDSSFAPLLVEWLKEGGRQLNVFAYNDSMALYNGKPVVSARGGTWHRSRMMLEMLGSVFRFQARERGHLLIHRHRGRSRICFFLRKNPDRGIYHTEQVERNGFIHSVFCGTPRENRGYVYDGPRAYEKYIK